jgi:uncharacterized protein YtpQ (UPF0354 family)
MGILFWRGRISKASFRRLFVAALQKQVPHLVCRDSPEDELVVVITGMENYEEMTQRLQNAYQEFQKDPKKKDEILGRWVDATLELTTPLKISRERIVPLVKSRGWQKGAYEGREVPAPDAAEAMCMDPYNDELIVTYVHWGATFHFLTNSDLEEAHITRAELEPLALANLRRMTPQRDFRERAGVCLINVGGNLEATMLLDETLWAQPRFAAAETLLVAVPDRNTILACTEISVDAVWSLAFLARNLWRTESYSITNHLFIRRAGRFEALDPLIEDQSHPIPRLDVLDVSAEKTNGSIDASIVIAAPLDDSPRSTFRLFRKLEAYLTELGCAEPGGMRKPVASIPKINVHIHPESHPDIFAKLELLRSHVAERGATLVIQSIR